MASTTRPKYKGSATTVVIGIDIGTTFSGASYAVLAPNETPVVHDVVRFEGQPMMNSAKVPSIIYYDGDGRAIARGAEIDNLADDDEDSDDEDDEESRMRVKVEWFKLHLRPASSKLSNTDLPPMHLPKNGTAADVWSEFLHYMNKSVLDYIEETEIDGKSILAEAKDTVTYVLTHPNGWKGRQQDQIREAAVRAGLVPATPQGRSRIEFLSEGEASFHWCVEQRLLDRGLEVGSHIIICDAGGGTIDVSSFHVTSLEPLKLEEAAESESRDVGAVLVTTKFYNWVSDRLENSPYGSRKNLSVLRKKFDSSTKGIFKERNKEHRIKFGRKSFQDKALHIKDGHLVLSGERMASFFETSCRETVDAIRKHLQPEEHSYIFVVGGFSNSPWLYSQIAQRLASDDCEVHRSDSVTAKPVARGSVTSYIDHLVHSRVAKDTYISKCYVGYDETRPDHYARRRRVVVMPHGPALKDCVQYYVQRGDLISDGSSFRRGRNYTWSSIQDEFLVQESLIRYTGDLKNVAFLDQDDAENFQAVCTFSWKIPGTTLQRSSGPEGEFWIFRYKVIATFGETEIKCFLSWDENGEKKRSRAESAWVDSDLESRLISVEEVD